MKKAFIYIGVVIIVVEGFFVLNSHIYNEIYNERQKSEKPIAQHYKDATYKINDTQVTLKNGVSEMETAPGSLSKITTRYFGNEVLYDFNADGRKDVVFLLTQEGGGSGTFFYVVGALNTKNGYVGSQGLFLGDRIAPQTTNMSDEPGKGHVIIVNYADRAPDEPFSVQPSIGKSLWLIFDTSTLQFGEVAQDFEGEADPSLMTLPMKTWMWVSTLYSDDEEILPKDKDAFTLTFVGKKSGTFLATTDCNDVAGKFSITTPDSMDDPSISFSETVSTKKYCEKSQESIFVDMLTHAGQFHFTSRGGLIIEIYSGTGTMIFR